MQEGALRKHSIRFMKMCTRAINRLCISSGPSPLSANLSGGGLGGLGGNGTNGTRGGGWPDLNMSFMVPYTKACPLEFPRAIQTIFELLLFYFKDWTIMLCGVVACWIIISFLLAFFLGPDFVTCYLCEKQIPRRCARKICIKK